MVSERPPLCVVVWVCYLRGASLRVVGSPRGVCGNHFVEITTLAIRWTPI